MYIREVRAENLFSWESLCQEFEPNRVYSFKGYNGSGKSSIFEIITWVFFKKTTKKTAKKYDAKSGNGWITLSDGRNEIVVNRNTVSPATVVVNGEETTQENLEDILGCSYITFMSAVMCNQKRVSSFIQEDSGSGKAKIFGEMIGASILDKVRKLTQDLKNSEEMEYETYKAKIDTLQTQLEEIELDLDGEPIKAYVEALRGRIKKLERYREESRTLQETFNLSVEVNSLWDSYEKNQVVVKEVKDEIASIEGNLEELKEKADSDREADVLSAIDEYNEKQKVAGEAAVKIRDKKLAIEKEIEDLEEMIDGDGKCPTCGTQLTDKKTIKTQSEKLNSRKTQLEKIQSKLNKASRIQNNIQDKIQDAKHELKEIELNLLNVENCKKFLKEKKYTLKHIDGRTKPTVPRPDLMADRDKLNEHTGMVFDIGKEIEEKKNVVKNYKMIVKQLSEAKDGASKKVKKYELFKWLFESLPIMKLRFIDQNKVVVEDLINEQISSMGLPFVVKIDTQRELKKGAKIKDEFTFKIMNANFDKEAHRKDLSGGQEVCILLATQFAINSVSSNNLSFEIYDEIYGSLDDKNVAIIIDTIKQRGEQRQIFSISHKDEISNSFDESIHIKMEEGCSYVRTREN